MKKVLTFVFALFSVHIMAQQSVLISPTSPEALKFNNTVTEKITLYDNGPASKYGMGVQSAQFRLYVATTTDDFLFGVGSNTTFAEKFRIKGNGQILTKNRLFLGDAGSGESAGLWFNNNGNTAVNTFVGIDPTNKFGIYSPILVKNIFTADMATGGIRLDGSTLSGTGANLLSLGAHGKVSVDAAGVPGGRLTILENGNIGIGTITPAHQLTIFESTFGGQMSFKNNTSGPNNTDGFLVGMGAGTTAMLFNYENTDMNFATNSTFRMRLRADGNLELLGNNKIVNESFQALTLQNSWVQNGVTPEFYKDKEGRVHLKGSMASGLTTTNTVIATLPIGYRPLGGNQLFYNVYSLGGTNASIVIDGSNGQIRVYTGTMANTLTSIDGISFRAE